MKDDKLYLIHIIESINKIQSYLTGMDCAAFMKNRLRSWATILLPGQLRVKSIGKQRPLGAFRTLVVTCPKGVPGKQLLSFAGTIPVADLKTMEHAIEDTCEKVDLNEW